jgi:Domain of unknown function (DUF5069)
MPLDLTQKPPRSPRGELSGLCMLPRMIDIARAKLPGGEVGDYQIGRGLSALVLAAFGLSAERFVEIVRDAGTDAEVAAALGRGIAVARRAVGARLGRVTVADVSADLKATFQQFYGADIPSDRLVFDVLEADDRKMFPDCNAS